MNTLEQIIELKNVYNDIKSQFFKLQEYSPQSSNELSELCLLLEKYQNELISIEQKLENISKDLQCL